MKFETLISILFELLSKKTVSATYLAEKYTVSTRTIYRYIECLENAGIPLYTVRGKYGGISIIDTYKYGATFFTRPEYNQTIDALSAIVQSVPNKHLSSVLNKLKSNIRNEYSGFDIKSGNLIIDAGPWGDTVGYKTKLILIQKAIEENRVLSITYHDRNGERSIRDIEPHVIVFKQGLWYVYAYCHLRNSFRFFKTGRIEQAIILNQPFVRKDLSNVELPLNFWENNIAAVDVTMQVDTSVLSDVQEWLGVETISKVNDNFIANAKLPFDKGLVSKIMSFGNGIKVLEPLELKEEIKEQARKIVEIY